MSCQTDQFQRQLRVDAFPFLFPKDHDMLRNGWWIVATLTMLVGCSDGRPTLAKVTGTVKYKGQLLSGGTVVFNSDEGRSATAEVVAGEFADVMTFVPHDGVPVGKHKVTVFSFGKPGKGVNALGKNILPQKYSSPDSTDLEVEIEPGENIVDLELMD